LKIGKLIRANRRTTVLELLQEVRISVGSVEESLHELKVSKVSARWVPRLLSPEHRERRLVAVTQLLQLYERGAEFLDSIVTCDETWVHYFTPESKRTSKRGNTPILHPQEKRKQFFQLGRSWLLCSGIPRVSFTWTFSLVKKTINVQYYSTLLNEKVKLAIRSKRRKRQNSVFFLQDNICPHVALMMATLLKLKWDVLPHPPYSPYLAPSDYHLFGPMKGV
jgi:histone-lysine N-methyltransferase SETMAR